MKISRNALVLSGGGANGAFQVGALEVLLSKGLEFDIIAGVSVGSLNGALMAQDEPDLMIKIWEDVKESDVFLKKNLAQILWRLYIQGKRSIYDATPLYRLLQQYVSRDKIVKEYLIGFTSLESGLYKQVSHRDFYTNHDFLSAIYASSLMPILWEPVPRIKTRQGVYLDSVDGGLRDISPLSAVLDQAPDHIYIINCNNGVAEDYYARNIIDIIKRTFLDIILSEVIINDIESLLRINDLVLQARDKGFELLHPVSRKPYKYFEVTLINPPYKLGSPIDFDQDKIRQNFYLGRTIASTLF